MEGKGRLSWLETVLSTVPGSKDWMLPPAAATYMPILERVRNIVPLQKTNNYP